MKQYFIELNDLAEGKVSVQGSFESGLIDLAAENLQQAGTLDWSVAAERAGSEVRVTGTLKTGVELPCSRCLEVARCEVTKPFDLYFRQRDEMMFDEDEEVELDDQETRTAFFTGTKLAITEILREQLLLALPMKPLCKVDCKGLCPSCGTNLNVNTCQCLQEQFSPHMDTLLEIKKRLEERSS